MLKKTNLISVLLVSLCAQSVSAKLSSFEEGMIDALRAVLPVRRAQKEQSAELNKTQTNNATAQTPALLIKKPSLSLASLSLASLFSGEINRTGSDRIIHIDPSYNFSKFVKNYNFTSKEQLEVINNAKLYAEHEGSSSIEAEHYERAAESMQRKKEREKENEKHKSVINNEKKSYFGGFKAPILDIFSGRGGETPSNNAGAQVKKQDSAEKIEEDSFAKGKKMIATQAARASALIAVQASRLGKYAKDNIKDTNISFGDIVPGY